MRGTGSMCTYNGQLPAVPSLTNFLQGYSTARVFYAVLDNGTNYINIQWNLRTRDTMGPTILSLVERSSLSRRSNNTLKY